MGNTAMGVRERWAPERGPGSQRGQVLAFPCGQWTWEDSWEQSPGCQFTLPRLCRLSEMVSTGVSAGSPLCTIVTAVTSTRHCLRAFSEFKAEIRVHFHSGGALCALHH